jgi:hypothetical protein
MSDGRLIAITLSLAALVTLLFGVVAPLLLGSN